MNVPAPTVPELLFYRVSATADSPNSPITDRCCLLVLPCERDPRGDLSWGDWGDIRTEPGRWYRFKSIKRPRRVPLSEDEAKKLPDWGWRVEDPRPARCRSERTVLEQRTAHLQARAERIEAREYALTESLRLADKERNRHLWLARLLLKIPHSLSPMEWHEVEWDYEEAWCRSRSIHYSRDSRGCSWTLPYGYEKPEDNAPDLDYLRCIVFGWADGTKPEEVERAVAFYREHGRPVVNALQPIIAPRSPGPRLLRHIQRLPGFLPTVDKVLAEWPDSPIALARLEDSLRSEFTFRPDEPLVGPIAPGPFLDAEQRQHVTEAARKGEQLAQLLRDAQSRLERLGWTCRADGHLYEARPRQRGRKPLYLYHTIRGLYTYLQPIHQKTFGDYTTNPALLRRHISRLLSPFFSSDDISPAPRGPIWRTISNLTRSLPNSTAQPASEPGG